MTTTAYHYTTPENWKTIQETGLIIPARPLLRRELPSDSELPSWSFDKYIFAFPDDKGDVAWSRHTYGPSEWYTLQVAIGKKIILLKFDLMDTDEAFVVDRLFMAIYQKGATNNYPSARKKYVLSRVPAKDYDSSLQLPELIIKNPISLDRIILEESYERVPGQSI
jgi:hypothetical protein